MRTLPLILIAAVLFAQAPPQRQPTVPTATTQKAQTVTLNLTADMANAIETYRLTTRKQDHNATTGVDTISPIFPDVPTAAKFLFYQRALEILGQHPSTALQAEKDAMSGCIGPTAKECIAAHTAAANAIAASSLGEGAAILTSTAPKAPAK